MGVEISKCEKQAGAFQLLTESCIPRPIGQVFAFFSDARNLERITPPWLSFRVLTPEPVEMRCGTLIDYRLRIRGLPVRWQSEITAWDPPHRFVDEQRRGPYRYWRHEHVFESRGDGTLVRDCVTYRVPLGWIVNRLLVAPDLRRVFEYRASVLKTIFAGQPPTGNADSAGLIIS